MLSKKGKRPGGVAGPGRGANKLFTNQSGPDLNERRDEREEGSYSPSGHYDPREARSSRGRAKKLAEVWSVQGVGDTSAWEEYFEEAKGEVNWDDYVKWLKRKGWEYIETYPYPNPDGDLLYEVWRFEYAKLRSKKLFVPRHKENGKWVRGMPPVRVPYNLLELSKRPDEEITLVEG